MNQHQLKQRLDYDENTGKFYWKPLPLDGQWQASWNKKYAGRPAGTILYGSDAGYVGVKIGNVRYRAHRLAFIWMTGEAPEVIDHIDGNPANNSWNNLRACTQGENTLNRKRSSLNTTGYKGVSPYRGKYRATICRAGVWRQIGVYDDPLIASAAYHEAAKALHGEFRRPNV